MTAAFDHIAHDYDLAFTHTLTGQAQRELVWQYLAKTLDNGPPMRILELNCGTGEDALWMAQKGHKVWATDISEEMIGIAQKKKESAQIYWQVIGIEDIKNAFLNHQFDVVFSNFGGFNCLSPEIINHFFEKQLPQLLSENGRFIGVIMPRFCLLETLYFLVKFQFKNAFRRLSTDGVEAKLSPEISLTTWYYSVKNIRHFLPKTLNISHQQAVGFCLPPSYLNSFMVKRPRLFSFLKRVEQQAVKFPVLANYSDHFLIELKNSPK